MEKSDSPTINTKWKRFKHVGKDPGDLESGKWEEEAEEEPLNLSSSAICCSTCEKRKKVFLALEEKGAGVERGGGRGGPLFPHISFFLRFLRFLLQKIKAKAKKVNELSLSRLLLLFWAELSIKGGEGGEMKVGANGQ